MALIPGKDVLLFFEDVDRDTFFRNDRRVRRFLRKARNLVRRGKPRVSGFELWYLLLKKALVGAGCRVHTNAYGLARRNPQYPVGMVGYPHILDDWRLPNPAVVGPGMIDHPKVAPDLMKDRRFKLYVTTCDWYTDMFAPWYGTDRLALWYAGIDLEDWPDLSKRRKDIDVLVYDKVRWDRERLEPGLIAPILGALEQRGLSSKVLRYGFYDDLEYRALLARSRAMVFLCEHETQGMAYQEAMASGVPILAWEPGVWVDPQARKHDPNPIPATSVPYFSPGCGERFRDLEAFRAVFDQFWARLPGYAPREYVRTQLSLDGSARLYLDHLEKAARMS
jgi:glycosyltransferase involved in cell wall biosynthesis